MSLGAFHKFFILASIVLCGGVGVASYRQYASSGMAGAFYLTIVFGVATLGLGIYFVWFLKKSRRWPST